MNRRAYAMKTAALVTAMVTPVLAQSGGEYEITKSTVDSGGGTVTGGNYSLSGTIGQYDSGSHSGGDYVLEGGFWQTSAAAPPGCPCITLSDCRNTFCADDNACNHGTCNAGFCVFSCERFGDVQPPGGDGLVNLDDILCVLGGFANFSSCPNADISPCGGNAIISLDDILVALNAFAGANPCACSENTVPGSGASPLCGSNEP